MTTKLREELDHAKGLSADNIPWHTVRLADDLVLIKANDVRGSSLVINEFFLGGKRLDTVEHSLREATMISQQVFISEQFRKDANFSYKVIFRKLLLVANHHVSYDKFAHNWVHHEVLKQVVAVVRETNLDFLISLSIQVDYVIFGASLLAHYFRRFES